MQEIEYLARSADAKKAIEAQTYKAHINGVKQRVQLIWDNLSPYCPSGYISPKFAAQYHDLGKLIDENQFVLHKTKREGHLPHDHARAGTAYCLQQKKNIEAILIQAHHHGLDNVAKISEELNEVIRYHLDLVPLLLNRHQKAMGGSDHLCKYDDINYGIPSSLGLRILLSILVDADHSDAGSTGGITELQESMLYPDCRAYELSRYVQNLKKRFRYEKNVVVKRRMTLRRKLFKRLSTADVSVLATCNAQVGTGKTTAVLSYLLRAAVLDNRRRLFVVAPFTAIIDQTVDTLRKALVLPGENAEEIVAAHHHRVEFNSPELRQYVFGWHAPIVVTTAVQFFETLAANRPSSLRKLHQLPGSLIFIDEAHTCLPLHLWPIAWGWLKELSAKWGCRIVLGSGSLVRYWEIPEFFKGVAVENIAELVPSELQNELATFERQRISYVYHETPLDFVDLINWILSFKGPRLCIVNTVQTAAVLARYIAKQKGQEFVEHLSTALTAQDRKKTLEGIRKRLEDKKDGDWILVATSCIEAGVDLSFPIGFREMAGFCSCIQAGGRVSRGGEVENACMHLFQLKHDEWIPSHPEMETAAAISEALWREEKFNGDSATEAVRRELNAKVKNELTEQICQDEEVKRFADVAEKFRVIEDYSCTAIVDHSVAEKIRRGMYCHPNVIMNVSVSLPNRKKNKYGKNSTRTQIYQDGLVTIDSEEDLYEWMYDYDDFLGYMKGFLKEMDWRQKTGGDSQSDGGVLIVGK